VIPLERATLAHLLDCSIEVGIAQLKQLLQWWLEGVASKAIGKQDQTGQSLSFKVLDAGRVME
jgi:hypothetical protein